MAYAWRDIAWPSTRVIRIVTAVIWFSRCNYFYIVRLHRKLMLKGYAPGLSPVKYVWDALREKYFHNRVFDSIDALEEQLELALRGFEIDALMVQSIVAWEWIVIERLN